MPLRRYFLAVGGVLLALIFVVDELRPRPATNRSVASHASHTPIRIHSDRQGPEAVVLDTTQPTIVPAATVAAVAAADTVSPASRVRESFAQLSPPQPKKAEPKPPPKRKIAASSVKRSRMLAAQPPFFAFSNNTW